MIPRTGIPRTAPATAGAAYPRSVLVLALDTSSPAVSAALARVVGTDEAPQVLAERVVVDARRHGELLAVGVRQVLDGVDPTQLAAVVVGSGPGPFTGLRVGLMTAAAMADALGVPAYAVCSLDAVPRPPDAEVVVATDARRREVYWARYDRSGARVEGPHVDRPAELAERLSALPAPPVVVGAGAVLHRSALAGLQVDERGLHPCPRELVRHAADRVRAGAPGEPLTPLYLRRPDAVVPGATKRVTA